MKTRTVIVLDDGAEITLEGSDSAYVGLQCPTCLTMFEIHGSHTRDEAIEIAELHKAHLAACKPKAALTSGKRKRLQ